MCGGDMLVLHQAALVEVGDLVWNRDDLFRVYAVEPDAHNGRVRICLEACRWGDLTVPLTNLVPVERLS